MVRRISLPPDARRKFDTLARLHNRETLARMLGVGVWAVEGLYDGGLATSPTVARIVAGLKALCPT